VGSRRSATLLLLCSPDWICGLGSILEDIVDWAFNSLIKKIGRGIQDFGDLIIVALEEFGAPVSPETDQNLGWPA
jgi:hypothetical protein